MSDLALQGSEQFFCQDLDAKRYQELRKLPQLTCTQTYTLAPNTYATVKTQRSIKHNDASDCSLGFRRSSILPFLVNMVKAKFLTGFPDQLQCTQNTVYR